MSIRSKRVFVLVAVLFGAASVTLFLSRSNPIVFAFSESGDPLGDPAFVLLNPFRDREPERAGERFLTQLPSPNCLHLVEPIRGEYSTFICEEENKYRAERVRLSNREDQSGNTVLSYRIVRNRPEGQFTSRSQLKLHYVGGMWSVTDFQPVY